MDDEFKLCWKNFQDNIASGFQNLYDRGDLVDVTLACDGKLLHAHKIVLAICSPYFQEIFITNPCKHPIIILKDVTFNIMCELLEFMYQGVVNVKHTELQSFMKIGQLLQIKGLATNSSSSAASTSSEKSSSQVQNQNNNTSTEETANAAAAASGGDSATTSSQNQVKNSNNNTTNAESSNALDIKTSTSSSSSSNVNNAAAGASSTSAASNLGRSTQSPASCVSPSPCFPNTLNHENFKISSERHHPYASSMKRHLDLSHSDALSIYSRKHLRRAVSAQEHQEHNDSSAEGTSMDQMSAEDFFLPAIPHISMVESRYDLSSVKREAGGADHHLHHHGGPASSSSAAAAAAALRNSFGPAAFGFDYNLYKNSSGGGGSGGGGSGPSGGPEFPNDLHMPSDYSKNFGNHMDIPPNSSNVVMLSSTSLLHGSCVFNRNNTVATQQVAPGEHWFQGKLEFMLSQRGKPLLVHDGHTFGIQYVRKDKKYWQCNLSRKFNCKARVTTTDTGEIIVTNNEHCHTEIRQHLRKDYQRNKVMMNALINLSTNRLAELRRHQSVGGGGGIGSLSHLSSLQSMVAPSPLPHPLTPPSPASHNSLHSEHSLLGAVGSSLQQQHQQQHQNKPQTTTTTNNDDDDDTPLDCGIRSLVASSMLSMDEVATKINTTNNNNINTSTDHNNASCLNLVGGDDWKSNISDSGNNNNNLN